MKKNHFVGIIFCLYPFHIYAETSHNIEERLSLLEQRVTDAENKEADKTTQSVKPMQATDTTADKKSLLTKELQLTGLTDIKFYGDVEFNMDTASRTGSLTSVRTSLNKEWAPGEKERWDINGRILLGFDGSYTGNNGHFSGFSVQPLADMTGDVNLDDAVFYFGQKDDWKIKVGRFEAYDMFPLNQDTFVEYSGNTANDLYSDGYGYIYMMKEGRGRSSDGGNFLLSKQIDNWYFELNTLVEDGSSLFVDSSYHGRTLDNQKNVIYTRPVISWKYGNYNFAVGMEKNLVRNAYGSTNNSGTWVDQSQRTGYGLTMNWDTLKQDPDNGMTINFSTAYMDAVSEKDFSVGVNGLWRNIELGYIYAHNNIEQFDSSAISDSCDSNCALLSPGRYDIHTIHTSWKIPDIMDMPNFNIYLGAYVSWLNSKSEASDSSQDRYGARLRFKYLF
ncbi:carbohydrate porin (plasmid) [Klebsiella sp. B345]|uniref:carbohydrate porin n=1 Tax=Klebsiella sp. B345 TaxID=2755398 RepID=UPI003DA9885E